ncbi:Protein SMAX1-LIKE like [Quillaja saponaria]|uniref:Protein SMAX1-LIKE like n=1 Tax=Quillaja saponaria TaxID=32244 RepID=A0AAD7LKN4_QUISA|nr:Protein SMAX1-LIKE like [Quillaja saponaria]
MPTPVRLARQCLTQEAAHVLDEAVSVARRRGHAQTTSLHAVSALLSIPTSILREACARARNSAYSHRFQFKALELCLSVSLDRVPSTQLADDPPVSNSLMAAIKRSQANQRRQPENFHLYHQISQQTSSVSCVKVELQHLILSILDDPVLSRVFGEAGFRSSEVKLAILRPLPQLLRYSRSRAPPLFLCNFTNHTDPCNRGFDFRFSGFPGFSDGDENCRRIGEVLARGGERNPLLVGAYAYDALRSFTEAVDIRKDSVLPVQLSGLNVISIGKDVTRFLTDSSDKGPMNLRFMEVAQMVEQCLGPGLVVNFGDLKSFVDENASHESVTYVIDQLSKLLELNCGKLWLMGSTANNESYLKFLSRFPSIKEWDLQLLPINSIKPSMAESSPWPRSSLMDSFVPFGGFFSDCKGPLSSSYQCVPHLQLYGEKFDEEVHAVSKERRTATVADCYPSSSPSWLRMAEPGTAKRLNMKIKDDRVIWDSKYTGLHKKWDKICQHQFTEADTNPTVLGFHFKERMENVNNHIGNITDASPNETRSFDLNSCIPVGAHNISSSQSGSPSLVASKAKNESFQSRLTEKYPKVEESDGLKLCSFSNSSVGDGSQTSPTSVTSVTTDLGLGLCSTPTSSKPTSQFQMEPPKNSISHFSSNTDLAKQNNSNHSVQLSSCLGPSCCQQFDPRDVKMLYRALTMKISWQDEAISVISQTIAHCRARSGKHRGTSPRGDIWLNFMGPDMCGKKRVAVSLAELLYGGQENFIFVDLSSQDLRGNDVKFRGKTIVDYIVGELCKRPLSVVFLESVDKADVLTQNSLSQAISTGKISDSHGREVGVNNAIFVTTLLSAQNSHASRSESSNYYEEKLLKAKGWPMQITVEHAFGDNTTSKSLTVVNGATGGISSPIFLSKRKLIGSDESYEQHETSEMPKRAHKTSARHLDLNLPAIENALLHTNDENSENDSVTEDHNPWLQDLFDQVDETVVFKPYNFVALEEKVLNEVKKSFHEIIGSEYKLEIESTVMEQLLAAAYVSDRNREMEDWVEKVLSRGFAEVQKDYSLTAQSIVKLATCECHFMEDQEPGFYLPPRIILN